MYSFRDYNISIASILGVYSFIGEGVGGIEISPTTAKTSQQVSADGTVMDSLVAGNNASFTISCQQIGNAHKYLQKLYNAKLAGGASVWNGSKIVMTNKVSGEKITIGNVSFAKLADRSYQAEGQNVSWSMLCQSVSFM